MPLGVLRLHRFFDAPLALLIGTPAKRVKEKGAPSLKHPFARVFPHCAHFAAGDFKVGVVRAFLSVTDCLSEIGGFGAVPTSDPLQRSFVNDRPSPYPS